MDGDPRKFDIACQPRRRVAGQWCFTSSLQPGDQLLRHGQGGAGVVPMLPRFLQCAEQGQGPGEQRDQRQNRHH